MYIYAEKITPRLQYIINTFFNGVEVVLTTSAEDFHSYSGSKINYSTKRFSNKELLISPTGLLFQTEIKQQHISCSDWNRLKIFFQSTGDIPFDVFSASFYLLSRYEEYLPHKKDSYGRFAHEASLAFKEGFLHLPLVNLWMQQFFKLLQQKFPEFQIPITTFAFTPTYDIDIAFAYKGKSVTRKIISKLRREQTFINGKDAFDVYEWLDDLHKKHQLKPVYFFLLAKQRSKYDKNLSPRSYELRQLIKETSRKYTIGIHPSWQSFYDEHLLKKEITTLQNITQEEIASSRQHYIQFTLPQTYRELIAAGITNDFSMGYGSINGFRASFAHSFYWYDLMKEQTTSLQLHPFCYMEANSFFEQQFTAEQAAKELQEYYEIVKQVNGNLITIFHNHFLTEQSQWLAWRKMYEAFLDKNFASTQTITSLSQQVQL